MNTRFSFLELKIDSANGRNRCLRSVSGSKVDLPFVVVLVVVVVVDDDDDEVSVVGDCRDFVVSVVSVAVVFIFLLSSLILR